MSNMNGTRVTFICSEAMRLELETFSRDSNVSRSNLITRLLRDALDRSRTIPLVTSTLNRAPVDTNVQPAGMINVATVPDPNIPRPGHGARPSPNQLAVLKRIPSSMVE